MSKLQARSAIKLDLFADTARKHKIETLGEPMTVEEVDGSDISCVWSEKKKI